MCLKKEGENASTLTVDYIEFNAMRSAAQGTGYDANAHAKAFSKKVERDKQDAIIPKIDSGMKDSMLDRQIEAQIGRDKGDPIRNKEEKDFFDLGKKPTETELIIQQVNKDFKKFKKE